MLKSSKVPSFAAFVWGLILYILGVILWGAYVRATGAGAGCGNHWPLCNGQVIPASPEIETIVEFTHRLTSGFGFLLVLVLFVWAFSAYPKGSLVRTGASLSLLFMVTEALVGAGLVLFGLVAEDDSFARAWVMAFHLLNTHLLLGCLVLTAWWASGKPLIRLKNQAPLSGLLFMVLGALIILGASGAVAALGDTLFPAQSLSEALQEDFSASAHLLIRLRVYHPMLALVVGLLLISVALLAARTQPYSDTKRLAFLSSFLYLTQLGVGVFNLLLLAPVWLQLIHLLMADLTWMAAVLLTASALGTHLRHRS